MSDTGRRGVSRMDVVCGLAGGVVSLDNDNDNGEAWVRAGQLETVRLVLRPVSATDASEAAVAFGDPALHEFTGGEPASVSALRERYANLESQRSPDGAYAWLNWIARLRRTDRIVATVQVTVDLTATAPPALLAWVTAADY